ncbi:MAG: acetyl-CoA C-acyltransferase [Dehalococcoidia bacterium]|jgi:acetyl-CoA C-acetyltransferase|nr:acetyl-CoA C-acyltransferase [Chloroflexota bacterium]MDP6056177.1 acetyl-CoA C-acyltransferase [Dehalococcoidia bacterium]MDP7089742.1 acetyl-CoA C-acyltransferase [Dehalococcoidia bacterium]MDP7262445.1 acetyl-CoA C-acyltransferase [Dehalococcoidia bacterium]MDP7485063.1 acetyl-CoA C-acyltransferase [Dehalococcoidia bacterium]|tara:strand:- start:3124 stop:4320 length:1197 start_codon:yes stop_codon:yes gene_type:complete
MVNALKEDVFITGAARTPLGRFQGGLSNTSATVLGTAAIKAAVDRSGLDSGGVEYTVMGNMLSAGLGQTPARQAAIGADIPNSVSALTINKACASGMQAVILASQSIQLGETSAVVAGGMENMSAAPHLLIDSRTGQRLGDTNLVDSMIHDGLWCPFENRHMGGSAEAISEKYSVTREQQDEFSERSHRLASTASAEGSFSDEITPVEVAGRRGKITIVETDEGPRSDTTIEGLAALPTVFPPGTTVTPGNASSISDGAAAVIVANEDAASSTSSGPVALITGYAHAANEPGMLFDAPRLAVTKLLDKTRQSLDDFDLIEINEAFAAQVLANGQALNWDWDRVNLRGGAIALGHPIGASGARILVTLLYGLQATRGTDGIAVICHAGGGAVAMSLSLQ